MYRYYIVREDILPKVMKQTIKAKEMIDQGIAANINQAVKKTGISRSAFYKYKDYIHPLYGGFSSTVCIELVLEDKQGVLSKALDIIAKTGGNILTINQGLPLSGRARVSIYIQTENLKEDLSNLVDHLIKTEDVLHAKISDRG